MATQTKSPLTKLRLWTSPADHNDRYKLELSEPGNLYAKKVVSHLVREKDLDVLFLMETKQSIDEMKKLQADLRYHSMLAIPSI